MSGGALVQLVSKGVQDGFCLDKNSFFHDKYSRHSNFTQAPARIDIVGTVASGSRTEVEITKQGDLINYMWLEGTNIIDYLAGTTFELHINQQIVDTQTFEYMSEIWGVYLANNGVKASMMNNTISQSDKNFFPLQFFFTQTNRFLPLVNMQYAKISVVIKWGPNISGTTPKVYGNYIYLDTEEREHFVNTEMNLLITQVQREAHQVDDGNVKLDMSSFNHPVKALFWGQDAVSADPAADYFTFDTASILLNGKPITERMSPNYYHSVQGYYHTTDGNINFVNVNGTPFYTRYFMYSFAKDATSYDPTGECNFSRMDNASLHLENMHRPVSKQNQNIQVYAINYNILRISKGISGILFSN